MTEVTTPTLGIYYELTLEVDGMTCASCSSAIESCISMQCGIKSVAVNLATNSGKVVYIDGETNAETICNSINDIGYDARIINNKRISPVPNTTSTPVRELTIEIERMTCSSCATTVESCVSKQNGIKTVIVNLATNSCKIIYCEGETNAEAICHSINDIGYNATITNDHATGNHVDSGANTLKMISLVVESTACGYDHSPELMIQLSEAFKAVPAVSNVHFQAGEKTFQIEIIEELGGPRDLLQVCSALGVPVHMSLSGSLLMADRMRKQYETEARLRLRELMIATSLTLPIIVIEMIMPLFPAAFERSQLQRPLAPGVDAAGIVVIALAAVVQVYIGSSFYRSAFKSLRNKDVGMSFLVSFGTTAAFVVAVVGFIRGASTGVSQDMDISYAETSAVLLTVVVLGKYLECVARRKTSAAISGLGAMKPTKARLVTARQPGSDNSGDESLGRSECEIDATLLHLGDVVRLVEGENAPADGVLVSGEELLMDEALLTGESMPVSKTQGDAVIGGSVVVGGTALMRVTACGESSVLGRIVSAMQDAQLSKPPIQEMADAVAKVRPINLCLLCARNNMWTVCSTSCPSSLSSPSSPSWSGCCPSSWAACPTSCCSDTTAARCSWPSASASLFGLVRVRAPSGWQRPLPYW